MTTLYPELVIDEQGHKHFIKDILGQGGQGVVFRTNDSNIVVKAVTEEIKVEDQYVLRIKEDEKSYRKFRGNINEVRILDLPKHIQIARPSLLLKEPMHGYVMRLLDDMVPIKDLMLHSGIDADRIVEVYNETGGLKRRLKILARLAKIFTELQSRIIVYADISAENVFVSKDLNNIDVWLIDADNMRYSVDVKNGVVTLGYAAPEVYNRQSGNTTYSDAYSFAILAYSVLAWNHPFHGDVYHGIVSLNDEEEDESDIPLFMREESAGKTLDEQIDAGELPWVLDEDDQRNHTKNGLPHEKFLHPKLLKLFQQTFSNHGKNTPEDRPTMKKWYKILTELSKQITTCKECGSTYYFDLSEQCPDCLAKTRKVVAMEIRDLYREDIFNLENLRKAEANSNDELAFIKSNLTQLHEEAGTFDSFATIEKKLLQLTDEEGLQDQKEGVQQLINEQNKIKISTLVKRNYTDLSKNMRIEITSHDAYDLPIGEPDVPIIVIERHEMYFRILNVGKKPIIIYDIKDDQTYQKEIYPHDYRDVELISKVYIIVQDSRVKRRAIRFKEGERK